MGTSEGDVGLDAEPDVGPSLPPDAEEEPEVGPSLPPESAEDDPDVGPSLPPEEEAEVGPAPVSAPAPKKRKTLEYEKEYLRSLPLSEMYEQSYMHRERVTCLCFVAGPDFLLTGSSDGRVKFWKKTTRGIEFAKEYRAHTAPVTALCASSDGALVASLSEDKTAKIFDVAAFDMIAMLRLPFVPGTGTWLLRRGDADARLALSDAHSPALHVYDVRGEVSEPELSSAALHAAPITAMAFHSELGMGVSADERGVVEYWARESLAPASRGLSFEFKMDTDLYALAQAGSWAHAVRLSPAEDRMALVCSDRRVRVFDVRSGRLLRAYNESLQAAQELQKKSAEAVVEALDRGDAEAAARQARFALEPIDFGR
ncbi:hypothetical protein H632_c112p2, partial [Helicosporidium sp. ATCC 50920]